MNVVEADVSREDGSTFVAFGGNRLRIENGALAEHEGRTIALGIRPEDIEDAAMETGAPDDRTFTATVDIREDMGSEVYLHFSVDAKPVLSEDVREAVEEEEAVKAMEQQAARGGHAFVARVDRESTAREGEQIRLVVDTRRLHFFEPESGQAISRG